MEWLLKMKAIYIRTSTEEQNPENQLESIKSMFEGEYFLYRDQQSAWKDNSERKDFDKLKQDIKTKKIKELYVWDFDRVYRNRKKFKEFLEFLKIYKCDMYSYNQRFINDLSKIPEPWNEMFKDFFIQLFGYMAEEESNHKSRRVKAAIRKRQDGAYSYKGNKWGRKTISTFKRNKINSMRSEGHSIRKIAGELNLSIGAVHKYLAEKKGEKEFMGRSSQQFY